MASAWRMQFVKILKALTCVIAQEAIISVERAVLVSLFSWPSLFHE